MTREPFLHPEGSRARTGLPDYLALPEDAARGLSPPLRDVQTQLLSYKSFFVGAWYESLASAQDSPDVERVLHSIRERAVHESLQLVAALQDWETVHADEDRLRVVREQLRVRLLRDLLDLKESANETLVLAAMTAPTADLRDRLLRLADEDRRNGDLLRRLLHSPTVPERRLTGTGDGRAVGAAAEGAPGELVSTRIRRTLDALRAKRETPVRLLLSGTAVRHLRDEGLVEAPEGTAFGVPVTVDFGWSGECFAVLTNECVSLAEIFTAEHTSASVPSADG